VSDDMSQPVNEVRLQTAQVMMSSFLIVIAGLLAYSQAFTIPLSGDDIDLVRDNEALQRLDTFVEGPRLDGTGPVSMFSLAFQRVVWGGGPFAFRFVDILLHVGSGVLLYLIVRRLVRAQQELLPMAAGLLFVLHPLATEAVNYVSARGLELALFFMLLSAVLFVHAVHDRATILFPAYILSVISVALAWGSHAIGALAPILVLLSDVTARRSPLYFYRLRLHFPILAVIALGVVAEWATKKPAESVANRILDSAAVAWTYLPEFIYPFFGVPYVSHRPEVNGVVAVTVMALLFVAALRWKRPIFLGLFWFYGALTLSIFTQSADTFDPDPLYGELNVNTITYPAVAGAAIVFGVVLAILSRPPILRVVLAGLITVLLAGYGTLTYQRNAEFSNPVALWLSVTDPWPKLARPYFEAGRMELNIAEAELATATRLAEADQRQQAQQLAESAQEGFIEAERLLGQAAELSGGDAEYLFQHGVALFYLERDEAALAELKSALEADATHQDAAIRIGMLLQSRGGMESARNAVEYYAIADTLGDLSPEIASRYGAALARLGRFNEAVELLSAYADDDGSGTIAAELEQYEASAASVAELKERARTILTQDQNDAEGYAVATQSLFSERRFLKAMYVALDALEMDADNETAWLTLGMAQAAMGQAESFLEHSGSTGAGASGADAWSSLARMVLGAGYNEAAETYLTSDAAREAGVTAPYLMLLRVAISSGNGNAAARYLPRAIEENPDSPEPWLYAADLNIAVGDAAQAQRALQEAESRGADDEALAQRRARLTNIGQN